MLDATPGLKKFFRNPLLTLQSLFKSTARRSQRIGEFSAFCKTFYASNWQDTVRWSALKYGLQGCEHEYEYISDNLVRSARRTPLRSKYLPTLNQHRRRNPLRRRNEIQMKHDNFKDTNGTDFQKFNPEKL
jgi:hypothetical protein